MVDFVTILGFLWQDMFLNWLKDLFVMPFTRMEMLWILVPVWLSWFFSEFYQEKVGTSMGNAISNATIILWAAIDCSRQTFMLISAGEVAGGFNIFFRFLLLSFIFLYGLLILVLGLRGNTIIKKIGRIREMSYVFSVFVPVFYNYMPLTLVHVISAIVFFPIFYYALELIDRILPDPKAIKMDIEDVPGAETKNTKHKLSEPENPPLEKQSSYPEQNPPSYPPTQQQPQSGQQSLPSQQTNQRISPLLSNRRKGGGFWDFKL